MNTVLENMYSSLKFMTLKFVAYVKELDRFFGAQRTQESYVLGRILTLHERFELISAQITGKVWWKSLFCFTTCSFRVAVKTFLRKSWMFCVRFWKRISSGKCCLLVLGLEVKGLKEIMMDRLGWTAFYGTLSRHRARYPWVLKELKRRLLFKMDRESRKRPPKKLELLQRVVDKNPF